ncbi:MAG: Type 1 glutamine amidotransferase-like domain-containing protein [Actinomycetota bacterium]
MSEHRTLSIFGSGEFEPWSVEIDRLAIDRARTGNGSVLILPTASAPEGDDVFHNWGQKGLDHYEGMEVPARVSALKSRADAHSDDHIAQIEDASLIYFSGGNPKYLADTLRDTPFWKAVMEAVDAGASLSGCSAGACIMGEIAPDTLEEQDWDKALATPGLKVFPGVTFGPHWNMLEHYIPGLTSVFLNRVPEGVTLITLDEDTAIAGDGDKWTVHGLREVGVRRNGDLLGTYKAGDTFETPAF